MDKAGMGETVAQILPSGGGGLTRDLLNSKNGGLDVTRGRWQGAVCHS